MGLLAVPPYPLDSLPEDHPLPSPFPPEGWHVGDEMHALVIEDDAVIAMLIEDELRDLGFSSVDVASSEEEAIHSVVRRCPNLVTSDGSLLSGSGASAVKRIRKLCSTPVIFVTGDPERARRSIPGVPVLEKPFSFTQFTAAVETALAASF
jgi:CheY-like chemotaxis protein